MLESIGSSQLKNMSVAELKVLCEDIRNKIITTVTANGGHLSSNLGIVELTVALHYVFDFPNDKIIFDVGHQCYPHKLLSGRYEKFDTLRKRGGIAGFPKREESDYDCYDTGHAGTSVSAALGIAKARDVKGENFNVIAVIGDGSFNNGLIYEAFNSLRPLNTNILVILNDNGMSISPTVGSMHEYLEQLSRDDVHKEKVEKHGNIFGRFGFLYDGVYDGNDLGVMIDKLSEIKQKLKTQSVILHVLTKKGKGYAFCEDNPEITHGVPGGGAKAATEYSGVLGKTLCEMAQSDKSVFAVTAAMTPSLGLSGFFEKFPERSADVGICEEHAALLCAALATQGFKPYYAVYSTFLQRSFDEIILDICSQNLPVTFCIDRAGVVGADGETHQGIFDLSFLGFIPHLTVAAPKDVDEFAMMLKWSATYKGPLAIRYPRESNRIFGKSTRISGLNWEILKEGGDAVILACGERMISLALDVCGDLQSRGLGVSVVNARFVKPLDYNLLDSLGQDLIITLEDNVLAGGFGSAVCCYFAQRKDKTVKPFGYGDRFIPQGSVPSLIEEFGPNKRDIEDYILKYARR